MKIRVATIAIAAVSAAAAANAEPDKNQQPAKAQKPVAAAPVVLASVSEARPFPADSKAPAEPVRRPAPRVTTCRCGDPQPEDSQPDQ
jgi:hypothetical protein